MDQATQQNAAMVEESTAASHAMAREAEALHELLRQFRYGEQAQVVDANRHIEDRAQPSRLNAIARALRGGQRTSLAAAPAADGWQNF